MDMQYIWKIDGKEKINLKDFDPNYTTKDIQKEGAETKLLKLDAELGELQAKLSAAHQNSILMLLQGTDTSGKDGTIRHVLSHVNLKGCNVQSFKEPTAEE